MRAEYNTAGGRSTPRPRVRAWTRALLLEATARGVRRADPALRRRAFTTNVDPSRNRTRPSSTRQGSAVTVRETKRAEADPQEQGSNCVGAIVTGGRALDLDNPVGSAMHPPWHTRLLSTPVHAHPIVLPPP